MSQPCKEQDKIRGKFIRAYYSNSAGGGLHKESLTEAAARAKANDPQKITRLPSESSMKTDIDIFWGLEEPLTKKLAKKVNQTVTLYSNGNFLIKKGNYKIEIKKGDNYTKNNNFYK